MTQKYCGNSFHRHYECEIMNFMLVSEFHSTLRIEKQRLIVVLQAVTLRQDNLISLPTR